MFNLLINILYSLNIHVNEQLAIYKNDIVPDVYVFFLLVMLNFSHTVYLAKKFDVCFITMYLFV